MLTFDILYREVSGRGPNFNHQHLDNPFTYESYRTLQASLCNVPYQGPPAVRADRQVGSFLAPAHAAHRVWRGRLPALIFLPAQITELRHLNIAAISL